MGVSSASLKAVGTEAVSRERLMMVVSTQSNAGWQVLKRQAGMGLRLQDLIAELVMNFWRTCGVIKTKDERVDGEDGSVRVVGDVVWSHASVGSEIERHE